MEWSYEQRAPNASVAWGRLDYLNYLRVREWQISGTAAPGERTAFRLQRTRRIIAEIIIALLTGLFFALSKAKAMR